MRVESVSGQKILVGWSTNEGAINALIRCFGMVRNWNLTEEAGTLLCAKFTAPVHLWIR